MTVSDVDVHEDMLSLRETDRCVVFSLSPFHIPDVPAEEDPCRSSDASASVRPIGGNQPPDLRQARPPRLIKAPSPDFESQLGVYHERLISI